MNPRDGQYALGGTLAGWVRLESLTGKQRRLLKHAYTGRNPWVYSRYGRRQWAAPLPGTRLVIKDPFAVISLPAVTEATAATPVLVYRHPGAVLSSYRRMGWAPTPAELRSLEDLTDQEVRTPAGDDDLHLVARMWNTLHRLALRDLPTLPDAIVVSHEELAGGGDRALGHLQTSLGLAASPPRKTRARHPRDRAPDPTRLHNLARDPREVATGWRADIAPHELELLTHLTHGVWQELQVRRLAIASERAG